MATQVAIATVAGPLHKWGYQHVANECISSQCEFADHVYMVQSTEDATGVKELTDKYGNLTLISNPGTWHHRPGETDEKLTATDTLTRVVVHNLSIGKLAAFRDGYEIILSTDINWYIPRRNIETLHKYCEEFRGKRETLGRVWLITQLHDVLLGIVYADLLLNLAGMNEEQATKCRPEIKLRRPDRNAIPKNVGSIHLVDCDHEMMPKEYEANKVRPPDYGYRDKAWVWSAFLAERVARIRKFGWVKPLDMPLDYWGQQIAAKSKPEFVSYQILKAMGLK